MNNDKELDDIEKFLDEALEDAFPSFEQRAIKCFELLDERVTLLENKIKDLKNNEHQ